MLVPSYFNLIYQNKLLKNFLTNFVINSVFDIIRKHSLVKIFNTLVLINVIYKYKLLNISLGPEWEWKTGGVTCCPSCQHRASMQVTPPREDRQLQKLQAELDTTRAELETAKSRLEALTVKHPNQ